jgi:hypothetical protein
MQHTEKPGFRRLLDPVSRVSEVLFGLIMALTFTGSLSAATAGQNEVRTMLAGAIGCNVAWGLIDAVMFLMTRITERGRAVRSLRAVRRSDNIQRAHRIIADALPPLIASILKEEDLEMMRTRLRGLSAVPRHRLLGKDDFLAACAVFLLVVLSTLPVAIPFMLMHDAVPALRVSNGIAVVLLFACGFRLGHYADHHPWLMGISMAAVGSVLVVVTIALGG